MIEMGIPEGFERRIQIIDPGEGITELHVLNVIVTRLQSLAGRLLRQDRDRTNQVVTHINHTLTQLHQKLQDETLTDNDRQGINIRITELKVHLKDKMTQSATQEDTRIDAFISKDRGRMTKCSFAGIKDKKGHKNIDKLMIDGQEITDQTQIVDIMRNRYMQCTGQEHQVEDNAVSQFLEDMDIVLPTLTPAQQEQIGDEITRDEVKEALQSAKAHSAPGPTGQTLGFYKFIFHQIPYLFTRCINNIVFYGDILDSASLQWIKKRRVIYIPSRVRIRCFLVVIDRCPCSRFSIKFHLKS
jgi:hypothetical protein